jgi:NTE family protein
VNFSRAIPLLIAAFLCGLPATAAVAQILPQSAAQPTDPVPVAPNEPPTKKRPKIGLVLSGGGARGAAQVGVIKVLEELRVPIDFIAGSSMGALVGAAYASGTPARELEDRLRNQDWDLLLTDESPRNDRSFQRKEEDQSRLLRLELGVKGGSVRLPPGAISGQKFDILFSQITRNAPPTQVFDELPIPFRAVATDAESGQMVIFDRGRLTDAMRASMSVPGAIAPYQIGDHIYLDGGLTRNLPVDVARQMGADIVIVVNIGTPLLKRQDIQTLVGVSLQMVNILTEQNVRTSIESLKPGDVLISPPLDTIGAADFNLVGDAVTIGAASARQLTSKLRELSLPPEEYAMYRRTQLARVAKPIGETDRIDDIVVVGLEKASAEELKRTLGVSPGDNLDFKKLNSGVSRVFGTGYFERVNYSLLNDGARNVLTVDAREKQWGPNYLRFGITLAADTVGEGRFNLLMRYLQTQFNSAGAEWRSDFQLGRDRRFATQFFQPFSSAGILNAISVTPGFEVSQRPVDISNAGIRVQQSQISSNARSVDFGFDLTRSSVLRLGVLQSSNVARLLIGQNEFFPEIRYREGGARIKLLFDNVDYPNFPREGRVLQADYFASLTSLRATDEYRKAEVNYQEHLSFGPHTFSLGARYGKAITGGLNIFNRFTLGGFQQLSGYRPGELFGSAVGLARLTYYQRLAQIQNPFGKNVYIGLSAEAGRISEDPAQLGKTDTKSSFSVFAGFDTLIGPLYLGYGRARQRNPLIYLFLGLP